MEKQMQLLHGDCLELMQTIGSNSVDLILCDLPYGTTACKWDSVIPFEPLWQQYERIIKDDGAIVLTAAQPFASILAVSNIKLFRYDWIYEKPNATGFLNAKKQPLRAHESVLVFYKKQPTFNPQKTHGHARKSSHRNSINSEVYGKAIKKTVYDSSDRYPRSVQVFESDKYKLNAHPTQKPLALMAYLVETYSNRGDLVLDNCMGSGTTGVACVFTGRKFIGIEKDLKYFSTARDRINTAKYENSFLEPNAAS